MHSEMNLSLYIFCGDLPFFYVANTGITKVVTKWHLWIYIYHFNMQTKHVDQGLLRGSRQAGSVRYFRCTVSADFHCNATPCNN